MCYSLISIIINILPGVLAKKIKIFHNNFSDLKTCFQRHLTVSGGSVQHARISWNSIKWTHHIEIGNAEQDPLSLS